MRRRVTQVKSRLFITSPSRSSHPLEGAYKSLLRGRGTDFEDIREYEYGDQVRDIDWRASARHGELLVKRMRAPRRHTVMFAVDTSRTIAALAADEKPKRDMVTLVAGVLGYLTIRHGDDIALTHGDSTGARALPAGRSEAALERMLEEIETAVDSSSAAGSIDTVLERVASTVSRRVILVVIADEAPMTARTEELLKRLRLQHDVLWLTVADADPVLAAASQLQRTDVMSGWAVPSFLHGNAEVRKDLAAEQESAETHRNTVLDNLAISHTTLTTSDAAIGELLAMLDRRAHVRG